MKNVIKEMFAPLIKEVDKQNELLTKSIEEQEKILAEERKMFEDEQLSEDLMRAQDSNDEREQDDDLDYKDREILALRN